jgi:hypothetical protein
MFDLITCQGGFVIIDEIRQFHVVFEHSDRDFENFPLRILQLKRGENWEFICPIQGAYRKSRATDATRRSCSRLTETLA